jgi:biopolymer transport protein ExbB/TolQ
MGWTLWLVLGVSLVSLYVLALIAYRVFLSGKALQMQIRESGSLIAQAQDFEELELTPATPSAQEDLSRLMMARRAFLRAKEQRAKDNQRRLVARIRDIEIDKR